MTGYESDRVQGLFAEIALDVSPAPAGRSVCVLYAPASRDPEVSRLCASVLSEGELQRASRFAAEDDRGLFEQRRAFRRFCGSRALESSLELSEIHFSEAENGRPHLADRPDLWFSFSSCRLGMLGAWSSSHAVGVDIEDPSRPAEAAEIARRFFSVAEAEVVDRLDGRERLQVFYRFWTLKEAALKSIGEGLPYGLDAFEFELEPTIRAIHAPPNRANSDLLAAYTVNGTEGCAALVTRVPAGGFAVLESRFTTKPVGQDH